MNTHNNYPKVEQYRAESQAAYDLMHKLFPGSEPQAMETDKVGIRISREQMDHGPDIVVTMWRPRGAEHGFHLEGIADTPMNDAWTDTLTFRFAPNKAMVLYELDDLETEQRMSHEEQIVFEKLLLLPGELSDFFADSSAQTA